MCLFKKICILLMLILSVGVVYGEELNVHFDDLGEFFLNEAKVTFPKRQTPGEEHLDTTSVMVDLVNGQNIAAAKLKNISWGGQFMASMLLGEKDTFRTDATWKSTFIPVVGDNWKKLDFDDSSWDNATDIGDVESTKGFSKSGKLWANMYYQKARRIVTGNKVYFRHEFNSTASTGILHYRGNNFSIKIYINGQLITSSDAFTQCDTGDCTGKAREEVICTLNVGSNCIAIESTEFKNDGNGVLMKLAIFINPEEIIKSGIGDWYCSNKEATGWKTVGFNNSNWPKTGIPESFDPLISSKRWGGYAIFSSWIWPTEFWFRKKFNATSGSTQISRFKEKNNVVSKKLQNVEYYSVNGVKLTGPMRKNSQIVIEKSSTGKNQLVLKKFHR